MPASDRRTARIVGRLFIGTFVFSIGGSLAFLAATGALFDVYERRSAPRFLLTFPEMIFGIYLVAKGFASPAMRRDARARHSAPRVAALG